MKLLEAIQTAQRTRLYCVGYAWHDPILGECENHTVVDAVSAAAAKQTLRTRHPHLTRAWIVGGEA